MNILHVNNTDLAGGRFNGYYMNQQLDESFNIEMVVWNKESKNSNIYQSPPDNLFFRFFAKNLDRISVRLGFDGLTGFIGWILPYQNYFKRSDIVHIHQIHNHPNFSILSLPMLSRKKPVIWTIHDPWAITGGCEHSFECNRWLNGCKPLCPHPRRVSLFRRYTPYLHWKIKKFVYKHSNLNIVVASKWMKDRIEKSPLLSHLPCHHIPFGIDLEVFKPRSKKECRKKFGIPLDHKVIAFRGIENSPNMSAYKGAKYLLEALKIYEPNESTTLIIFDSASNFKILSSKYNILSTGWIDGENLAIALSSADIFMMPSVQESFGLMAVESMACGTPVVVFEGTALPDVIKSPLGGIAVPEKNSFELAKAIKKVLENDEFRRKLGVQARQIAEQEYSFPQYVQRLVNLYDKVIKNHHLK